MFTELSLSLKGVLESYKHIELTEEEILDAILWAKRKKEDLLKFQSIRDRHEANRKLAAMKWDYDIISTFMINRAKEIFVPPQKPFVIDDDNFDLFELLCYYFIEDELNFFRKCKMLDVENPSLDKGLLIASNVGIGKTWMMKLFTKNARQVYFIRNAKDIAAKFATSEDKKIPEEYLVPFKNAVNDVSMLYQPIAGLCIDDIGSEELKNNYGNKSNVIGELIDERYQSNYTGPLLHGTTNLSAEQLNERYGERIVSRMRERFNFIPWDGKDRRK